MKAIMVTEFGGPQVLRYTDAAMPEINDSQVLIKVAMTSVNFADIKARMGNKGRQKVPFIPGIDAAGVIVKTGNNVNHLQEGQRVIAFPHDGSYAEYIVADANLTFPIPEGLPFDIAAASPVVSFLSHKLLADVARLEPGETVLIHAAAGGVGTTAVQMAKILGAGQVIGTVGSESKKEMAQESGYDHVFCYEKENFAEKVKELTNGQGANVILDSLAGRVSLESLECLADYGRLVHFGNSSGEKADFALSALHSSCRSVLGFSLGTTRKKRPELLQQTAEYVLSYLAEGSLKMKIGERFPLMEAAHAQAFVESRKSVGKVLLEVAE